MKKRTHLSKKEFLNKDGFHSIAAVGYTMELVTWEKQGKSGAYASCELRVQDCQDSVTLDLSIDSEETLENSRYKLATLKRVIEQAQHDLENVNVLYQESKSKDSDDDEDYYF